VVLNVRIDPREDCISCGACIAVCPDVFDWHEDGKSMIIDKWRINSEDPAHGNVSDDYEDGVQEAVDSCPVEIIHMKKE